jgi:hypothetical protein
MREQALRAVYESMQGRTLVTFEQFQSAMGMVDVHPVVDNGEVIGAALVYGQEIHLGLKREPTTPHRRQWREILGGVLERGPATTKVQTSCTKGIEFVLRLGFEETYRDEEVVHFILQGAPSWARNC